MLQFVRRFSGDGRGAMLERVAFSVAVIAVGFVATADVLDYMTRKHGGAIGAAARDVARTIVPADPEIDYSTTASIRQPIILDPCTGKRQ